MALKDKINDARSSAKDVADLLIKKKQQNGTVSSEEVDFVNIMIAGKTGVGKSSLINAVFGEELARTGIGAPVTQECELFEKDGIPVRIYDFMGFELNPQAQKHIRSEMKGLIRSKQKTETKNDDIHLVWYCIASTSSKVDPLEFEIIEELSKLVDVVIVMTKSYDANETRALMSYIEEEKEKRDLRYHGIVPVVAFDFLIDGGVAKEKFGIRELTEFSYELLPDVQKRAFAEAQKVSEALRKTAGKTAIAIASAAAGAAGAIPIPIADAAVLVPIQLAMLRSISNLYDVSFSKDDFPKLIAVIAPIAATQAGKASVASLLKLVPGIGLVVSAISGTVAAGITAALGAAYLRALDAGLSEMNLNDGIPDEFIELMRTTFGASIAKSLKESVKKPASV